MAIRVVMPKPKKVQQSEFSKRFIEPYDLDKAYEDMMIRFKRRFEREQGLNTSSEIPKRRKYNRV